MRTDLMVSLSKPPLALLEHSWLAAALYALVALMWLVPDPRIETRLNQ